MSSAKSIPHTFVGNSEEVESVQRVRDGKIFKLKDFVTNGTPMKGYITKFVWSSRSQDFFIEHTWSGIGMNVDSLSEGILLPSKFQIGHFMDISLGVAGTLLGCEVIKVHFAVNKILYDVEVTISKTEKTRIYNIEEKYCFTV